MSLLPADYLQICNACTSQTAAQIAEAAEITQGAALTRLTRLEGAGYIRRNQAGAYEQAKPFDARDVTRMISYGWMP